MDYVTAWSSEAERRVFENLATFASNLYSLFTNEERDEAEVIAEIDMELEIFEETGVDLTTPRIMMEQELIEAVQRFSTAILEFGRSIFLTVNDRIEYGPDILIEDLSEGNMTMLEFRFRKQDLQLMAELLWPKASRFLVGDYDRVHLGDYHYIHFETGFLLLLYRLMYPSRIRPEIERRFRISPTRISTVLNKFVWVFYQISRPYMTNVAIWEPYAEYCAELINRRTDGISGTVWAFIDGTFRATCRPTRHQREAYSGYRRLTGMKHKSLIMPNGLFAHFHGAELGSSHDAYMLDESMLLRDLRNTFPERNFQVYGDPAYPDSGWLFGGFRNHNNLTQHQRYYNRKMSSVRECVEWGFNEVVTIFAFLDWTPQQKILKMPCGCYYLAACFLMNLRTCLYGNQTSNYFNTLPLGIEAYLNLVPEDELVEGPLFQDDDFPDYEGFHEQEMDNEDDEN